MKSLHPNNSGKFVIAEKCQTLTVRDVLSALTRQHRKAVEGLTVVVGDTPVTFTQSTLVSGGKRQWFVCPQCHRRAGTLYKHPQTAQIACRKCLGIRYQSQQYKGMVEATSIDEIRDNDD